MENKKRLIDANDIVKVAEHAYNEWNLAMAAADGQRQINQVYKMKELCKAVKAVADAAPTVDAVEVVRCKDCKYAKEMLPLAIATEHKMGVCTVRKEDGVDFTVWGNDFCSYGERREGE